MNRRFVALGFVLSGTGAVFALIYRSYLKRRIQRLLGFGCDDNVSVDDSGKTDIPSPATTARGHLGATKDIPLLTMEEVTMPLQSDIAIRYNHSILSFRGFP